MPTEIFPWQQVQWQRLASRREAGRLPHALLLAGPVGTGKGRFARRFIRSLLCMHPGSGGEPCGRCRGCTLDAAGTHPDLLLIEPQEPGKAIRVDAIRALAGFTSLKPHCGGRKVVCITPAEQMNAAAANSLLKTLEEPAGDTVLILISNRTARLRPTIRSRCQVVAFPRPPQAQALAWLEQQLTPGFEARALLAAAHGAPLNALALAQGERLAERTRSLEELEALRADKADPLEVAAAWRGRGGGETLEWLRGWIMDMIRLGFAQAPQGGEAAGETGRLQHLAGELELRQLFSFLDELAIAARLRSVGQVNEQLLLEDLLIRWTELRNAA